MNFRQPTSCQAAITCSLGKPQGFYIDKLQAVGAAVSGHNVTIGSATQVRLTLRIARVSDEWMAWHARRQAGGGHHDPADPEPIASDPFQFHRDQSDSDGSFTLQEITPGRYTLVAIENGWNQQWADPVVFKQWLNAGEAVQVAPNGEYTVKVRVQ